jgi:hypothetical protein
MAGYRPALMHWQLPCIIIGPNHGTRRYPTGILFVHLHNWLSCTVSPSNFPSVRGLAPMAAAAVFCWLLCCCCGQPASWVQCNPPIALGAGSIPPVSLLLSRPLSLLPACRRPAAVG